MPVKSTARPAIGSVILALLAGASPAPGAEPAPIDSAKARQYFAEAKGEVVPEGRPGDFTVRSAAGK